jgi:hypothetical protein
MKSAIHDLKTQVIALQTKRPARASTPPIATGGGTNRPPGA